jgi:ribosome maturation factor RimP
MNSAFSELCILAKSELENIGCTLVDLELARSSSRTHIRLYVDRDGGVRLKEIEEATRNIRDRLDESNLFGERYSLEVSSPGPNRSLRGAVDLGKFRGKSAAVYMGDGTRKTGLLAEADQTSVTLRTREEEAEKIPRGNIRDMHLVFLCDERGV